MLTHPTSDLLEALGSTGMAKALDEQRRAGATFKILSFEERLGLLVDREATERDAKNRCLQSRGMTAQLLWNAHSIGTGANPGNSPAITIWRNSRPTAVRWARLSQPPP